MVRASSLGKRSLNAKKILVPFDFNGNMQNYSYQEPGVISTNRTGYYDTAQWKDNYEFTDSLEYKDMRKGRSALNATFKSTKDGKEYTFFMKDFHDVIPKMVNGVITGKFTFVKRGANFGIVLLDGKAGPT